MAFNQQAAQKILSGGLSYGGVANLNSDAVANLAEQLWEASGSADAQQKMYGSRSIDAFSGNRASLNKQIVQYLETGRWPISANPQDQVEYQRQQQFAKLAENTLGTGIEKMVKDNTLALTDTEKAQYKDIGPMGSPASQGTTDEASANKFKPISGPSALQGLKETDLARTTSANIYRRDLKAEQVAMTEYSKTYGQPKSDADWRRFHEFVYEAKTPDGKPVAEPVGPGGVKQEPSATTVDPSDTTTTTEKKDFTDITSLPDNIKNDPAFLALSPDNQALAAFQWNSMQASDALTKIRAKEALVEATKLAEPAFKQALLLATDDIERNLSSFLAGNKEEQDKLATLLDQKKEDLITKSDRLTATEVESALKDMESIRIIKDQAIREGESREASVAAELGRTQRRITAISEDLQFGRDQISLEEQAQLARSLREYERNLQSTQEEAVDAGLGFSSIRTQAEQRLAEDLQDVSESTRRQKLRERRALDVESGRDTTELLATQADIERKNQEERLDIARKMEQKVGWEGVPESLRKLLPDSTAPLGIRGEATEMAQKRERELKQQREDLSTEQSRAEAEALRQGQILERKREEGILEIERDKEKAVGTSRLGADDTSILSSIGEKPLGDIQGSLEADQTSRIQNIQSSILDTQPRF